MLNDCASYLLSVFVKIKTTHILLLLSKTIRRVFTTLVCSVRAQDVKCVFPTSVRETKGAPRMAASAAPALLPTTVGIVREYVPRVRTQHDGLTACSTKLTTLSHSSITSVRVREKSSSRKHRYCWLRAAGN